MTVLIIADSPEFARSIISRWLAAASERQVPEFTVIGSAVWLAAASAGEFDAAIIAPQPQPILFPMLAKLNGAPALCVADDVATARALRERYPRLLVLPQHEGWLDALVLLAAEVLRRVEIQRRAERAEQSAAVNERYAVLGRYMLEMRSSFANALTSVLGHSELLLSEPGELSAAVRDQLKTIRTMALRMHEVLQRFSSLDTEMIFVEQQSHCETPREAPAYPKPA